MTGLRIAVLGAAAFYAACSLGLTGCSHNPCSVHHVVTASSSGMKVDQVELDDGYIYVPLPNEAPYAHAYSTGTEVRLCEVTSQLDGSIHFSIIATNVLGSPTEMKRLQYQGLQ